MEPHKIGFALCGSFCTFKRVITQIEELKNLGYEILPIMSQTAYSTDTRFGKAEDFIKKIEDICQKSVLHTLPEVEPFGPKAVLDALVIAPCTGNTIAKIATGISDTSVSLAVKAHLRNERPVVIAISSNDALSANAKNIGTLLNTKNVFFAPFEQDDAVKKPRSLVAVMEHIPQTLSAK